MLSILTSILSFIVLLGVLIFIHELGHFLVAKKVGIRVDKFSLGFPPNIFSRKWRGTEYCLGLIPLGGYVKMAGEIPGEEVTGNSDEYASKTVLQRFLVIFAGPFMNYVLAIFIFAGLYLTLGEPHINETEMVVGRVIEGRPASQAGILPDDVILSVDGVNLPNFDSLTSLIYPRAGEEIEVIWRRGNDTLSALVTPQPNPVPNPDGVTTDTVGQIGLMYKVEYWKNRGIGGALIGGFNQTNNFVLQIGNFLKKLITRNVPANSVGGPIYILQESSRAAERGIYFFFFLMGALSVNLAVLNVLPIPVLDGGHMLFLLVEKIKGSPITMKVRMYAQQAGMIFLLGFILFVSWNDVARMISN